MTRKQAIDKVVEAQVKNWEDNPEKLKSVARTGYIGLVEMTNLELEEHYEFLTDKTINIL